MWGLNWTQTWSDHNDNLKLSAKICNWSVEWGLHFRAINHCKLSLWLHRAPHHMGQKLWQACQRWLVLPHHSVCLFVFVLLSVRAIHLRGPLLREERLEDKHLRHEWAQRRRRNEFWLSSAVRCWSTEWPSWEEAWYTTCPKPTHMMANVTKTLQIIVRSFRSSALWRP